MELFAHLRTKETSTVKGGIPAPCKGYYTNWRIWVIPPYDTFELKIGKKADHGSFHGSAEVLALGKGGLYAKFEAPGTLDAIPKCITGFSKKKMWVKGTDSLEVWLQSASPDIDVILQATFVPMKGEILRARQTLTPDPDGPLDDTQAFVVPVDGILKGIHTKAILHETTGATGGAFVIRYYLLTGDSYKTFGSNFADVKGDVRTTLDENPLTVEQLKYGQNELADFLVRTVQNEPTLVDFTKQMNKPVKLGDRIGHEWDAYLTDTTIDTKLMEITYFIQVEDTPNIMLATERIELLDGVAGVPSKYFMDLGSDFFVEV